MWWDHMFSWPSWIAMTFMMTIALGGLALLIALALRAEFRPPAADPRRLLDARLARGEIDAPEYRERVTALTEVHDA